VAHDAWRIGRGWRSSEIEGRRVSLRRWLKAQGGELLPSVSYWELARWRLNGKLGIAYHDQCGAMRFNSPDAEMVIASFVKERR